MNARPIAWKKAAPQGMGTRLYSGALRTSRGAYPVFEIERTRAGWRLFSRLRSLTREEITAGTMRDAKRFAQDLLDAYDGNGELRHGGKGSTSTMTEPTRHPTQKARQAIGEIEDAWREVNGKIGWSKLQLLGYDGILHADEARLPEPHAEMPFGPGDLAWLLRAYEGISDALAASRHLTGRIEVALRECQDLVVKHTAGGKKP